MLMAGLKLKIYFLMFQFFCLHLSAQPFRVLCPHQLQLQQLRILMIQAKSDEIYLKREEFRNSIRKRMNNDHMKRIRNQYLKIEDSKIHNKSTIYRFGTIQDLLHLLNEVPTKEKIARVNSILLSNRSQITADIFEKICRYVKAHFVQTSIQQLCERPQINDLIALTANILSFQKQRYYIQASFKLVEFTYKLLGSLQRMKAESASYTVWILFQISQIEPQTIEIIAKHEQLFVKVFNPHNIYLSYLISNIYEKRPDLGSRLVIEYYSNVSLQPNVEQSFCENILIIFTSYLYNFLQCDEICIIIKWVNSAMQNSYCDSMIHSTLLKLLYHAITTIPYRKSSISRAVTDLINQPAIMYEIVQRSKFDSIYETKVLCIQSINTIIKSSAKLQLQQLIKNYPSVLQSVVSSFTIYDFHIVTKSLSSIAKVITLWPEDKEINNILLDCGLKMELQILSQSENQQIKNLASVILEDYINN